MLCKISSSTGIFLDTVFTMKGMLCEMENNPVRFNGTRILFLHTGMWIVFIKLRIYYYCLQHCYITHVGGIFGNTTSGVLEESLLGMKDTNNIIRLTDIVEC